MSLIRADVEKIAWLARLSLDDSDIPAYTRQLSRILDLVDQLDTVDTADIEPLAHPLELTARLREDRIIEQNQREEFQRIAPRVEAGLYLVPKVIE
jgi:aspartyl-tRNA(Asn)/glutamyl-tRNA(Gln) amidotransferase subunit C